MASSPWLDLLESTAGLDAPLLHEHHGAYRLFNDVPDGHPQIVMLIRGRHTFLLPKAEHSIYLRRVGLPLWFAVDCGLHLPRRTGVLKAVPLGPSVSQYNLRERVSWPSQDLAYSLYSRLLSPF